MRFITKRSLFLLLLSISLLISSCASTGTVPITEGETPTDFNTTELILESDAVNRYDRILDTRFDKDFGGRSFRIATDNNELILADGGESLLGKEHYLRNAAIENKYNIKISLTEESGLPTIADRIKTEALAGTDYCDLILLESTSFQGLAVSKSLLNVRSIPYLDINADFYYERSLEATTLGEISYGIAGDFVFKPEDINVVFFNKTLLAQTPLPDLYSLIESNQWDMENFLLYSEEVFSLAQQNNTNVYGILSSRSQEDLVNIFWAASGMDFMKNEYGMRPELIFNNDDSIEFVERFRNIFFRSASFSSSNIQQSAISSFANGESLFLIGPISTAKQIVGRGIDWGIAPIPKFDINQTNYYSYTDKGYTLAGFAKGTADLNFSGIVTSAFFAASKGLNREFAVQSYLNLCFTSPKDAQIMQEVIKTPYYDPVEFFGQIDPSFTAVTQTLLYRSASNGTNFNALYNQYIKMLDKYLDTIF